MNLFRKITLGATLMAIVTAGAIGCGGGNDPTSFTIFPSSATVERGATFQFDTNPMGLLDVTWTVVGGAANGTIDADGLYTAPATIPVANNEVTIEAERDGFTASATVTLIAADDLSFTSPLQINDAPVPGLAAGFAILFQGAADQIGAGLGSVEVFSTWIGVPAGAADVMFSQSTDLAPFLPEVNVTNNNTSIAEGLILDQNLNPGIFFTHNTTGVLSFVGSSNQGGSFSLPVPVVNPASGLSESAANGAVDGDNNYYVVYIEDLGGTPQAKFATSTNQGASWSSPIPVTPSANDNGYPFVGVSEDGDTVVVCYTEDLAGVGEIFVSVSTNGGSSFSTQTNVSQSAADEELFCRVAVGPNGEIYVAYQQDNGDFDILFASSTNGGSSFNPPVTVNNPTAGDQAFPYMSVDSQGRIDIVWADDNNAGGGAIQLGYARSLDNGATFPNELIVPASAATTVIPRGLVHDASDRLHLQYFSDINSPGTNVDFFYVNGQ